METNINGILQRCRVIMCQSFLILMCGTSCHWTTTTLKRLYDKIFSVKLDFKCSSITTEVLDIHYL